MSGGRAEGSFGRERGHVNRHPRERRGPYQGLSRRDFLRRTGGAAIAVPAYAGIPVTHRGIAASFAVLTGHEDPSKTGEAVDWRKLATAVDTLVVLMAAATFPRIVGALLAHGRAPETPVALIRWGTTEAQEVRVGTLADIVKRARGFEAPVVAVIGEVVALRERLAWRVEAARAFEPREDPLAVDPHGPSLAHMWLRSG